MPFNIQLYICKRDKNVYQVQKVLKRLILEALRESIKFIPLDFFFLKLLLLDRLSKALAQLFLVC